MFRNFTSYLALSLGMACAAAPAAAQDSGQTPADVSDGTNDAAPDGDIIVTAQRREERLQDVPISIAAFSGDTLERSGISNSKELGQVVPGFSFAQSSYSPQPTIRGIGTRGVQAGDESVVPVYVDGVYQPFLASTVIELNSIERVEVLRGPQGALLGRNSTGGAVNVITATPDSGTAFRGSLSYGSFDEVIAKAFLNAGTDLIAGNVALLYKDDNGYLKNLQGGSARGDMHSFAVRGKLRLAPSERFDAVLTATRSESDDTYATSAQPLNGNTVARVRNPAVLLPEGPFETSTNGGSSNLQQTSVSLTAAFHADAFDITSISGFDHSKLDILSDNDATAQPVSLQKVNAYSKSFIQELYAASSGNGPFSWILGLTYFRANAGNDPTQILATSAAGATTISTNLEAAVKTRSIALYAQGTYDLTDALSLTLGGRWTSETRSLDIINLNAASNNERFGKRNFKQFTPSGTLKYELDPDSNLYFKIGQGFKSGIFSIAFPTGTADPTAVDPERVTQYELGAKLTLSSSARLNLSAFYTDYRDLQVNVRNPVTLLSGLQNAGSAELYGGEAELFVTPADRLNLRFGLSLLHGKYTDYQGAQVTTPTLSAAGQPVGGNNTVFIDATGNKIIRTPFITVSAGGDYSFDIGGNEFSIAANAFYSGKQYWEASNRIVQKGYVLVNAEIGWRLPDSPLRMVLWGKNLTNSEHQLYILSSASGDTQVFAPPRSVGGRLELSF